MTLTDAERMAYATAEPEDRYKLAATARTKLPVIKTIVDQHPDDQVLVIGAYLDQLDDVVGRARRRADHPGLDDDQGARAALRRVPPRRAAGAGGVARSPTSPSTCPRPRSPSRSRARSARGRRRRSGSGGCCGPKADGRQAHFYTVVARDTLDAEYAAHRQRFLAEQGYAYTIVDADDLLRPL